MLSQVDRRRARQSLHGNSSADSAEVVTAGIAYGRRQVFLALVSAAVFFAAGIAAMFLFPAVSAGCIAPVVGLGANAVKSRRQVRALEALAVARQDHATGR